MLQQKNITKLLYCVHNSIAANKRVEKGKQNANTLI